MLFKLKITKIEWKIKKQYGVKRERCNMLFCTKITNEKNFDSVKTVERSVTLSDLNLLQSMVGGRN